MAAGQGGSSSIHGRRCAWLQGAICVLALPRQHEGECGASVTIWPTHRTRETRDVTRASKIGAPNRISTETHVLVPCRSTAECARRRWRSMNLCALYCKAGAAPVVQSGSRVVRSVRSSSLCRVSRSVRQCKRVLEQVALQQQLVSCVVQPSACVVQRRELCSHWLSME
eukprot:UN2357